MQVFQLFTPIRGMTAGPWNVPAQVTGFDVVPTLDGKAIVWEVRTEGGPALLRTGTVLTKASALGRLLRAVDLPIPDDANAAAALSAEDVVGRCLGVRWGQDWSEVQGLTIRVVTEFGVLPNGLATIGSFDELVEKYKVVKR